MKTTQSQSFTVDFNRTGCSLANVSFKARTYREARRKVSRIAREVGLPNTPWTLSTMGRVISSGIKAVFQTP